MYAENENECWNLKQIFNGALMGFISQCQMQMLIPNSFQVWANGSSILP